MSGLIFIPRYAKMSSLSNGPVVQLLGGREGMVARTQDDRLFITGYNSEYATEDGVKTAYWKEAKMLDDAGYGIVKDFATAIYGFVLIRGDSYNYACGYNRDKFLGLPTDGKLYAGGFHRSHHQYPRVAMSNYARFLWGRSDYPSTVSMYGRNTYLGMSGSNANSRYFGNVMVDVGSVTAMASTGLGATARAVNNKLYLRGNGSNFQQNSVNPNNRDSNSITFSLSDTPSNYIVKIVAGTAHFLMLTAGGDVYSWGYNYFGQLGRGNTANSPIALILSNVKDISASEYGSVVLTNNNEVYHCGIGFEGNTAIGVSGRNLSPFKMDVPTGEIEAAVSTVYGIALLINGFVYTKGDSLNGTLGTNTSTEWVKTDPSNI